MSYSANKTILGSCLYASPIKPLSVLILLFINMNSNMLSFLKMGNKEERAEKTALEKKTERKNDINQMEVKRISSFLP